ncbi:MAG: hypothetical protein ACXW3K_02800 [Brevundimonas sp.]
MQTLFAALWFTFLPMAPTAQDPAPVPTAAPGEWMLLQHFYAGPTLGRGVDYWVSARDYGTGPDAEGIVRVRVVSPGEFDAALRPTRFIDSIRDIDCVNRRERTVADGVPEEWQTLPDFVPGSQMIFAVCSVQGMALRPREPDLAAALARSQELERLHRAKTAAGHY